MEIFTSVNDNSQEQDEQNAEKIRRDFIEKPSEEVELLANNLMRPDGFIKTLLMGKILTSEELQRKVKEGFVRTHRGFYQTNAPSYFSGANNDISFSVGRPQKMYARSSYLRDEDSLAGLGFSLPARKLMEKTNVVPTWGCFEIEGSLEKVAGTNLDEPQFDPYKKINLKSSERQKYEWQTPKEDFLPLTHLARKAGNLNGGDQAEVNIKPLNEGLPQISLDEMIILMPADKKEAIRRLFDLKKKELASYQEELHSLYGIDIKESTFDEVVEKYQKRIYWYPQSDIDLAIQYLSTHKEEIERLLA